MGLENPLYLDQFVSGNPGSTDQRHEGDDHIRNIKSALKNTLPGLAGRMWRKRNVNSSGPINLVDNMSVLNVSGTLTLTPAAAATLGNGWMVIVKAASGGVTINPAEPINGDAQMVVPQGYLAILFCDGTEFFTMLAFEDVPPSVPVFPSGTKLLFNQTTPPSGWTKLTTSGYNNSAIRLTTGTVGSGGVDEFTTTFSASRSSGAFSLTSANNGPHTHTGRGANFSNGAGTDGNSGVIAGGFSVGEATLQIDSSGSGSGHSHSVPLMNLKYNDCIVASKD